ncbi:glycosyltransferase family 4 protein [uncultured Marinococcus sp.]|uniref:glycosyltransferase family 4 protein n=1 Tax=uncultured Marinococcus sp. TaxID=487012 RepID=UPI00262960DD|nr:glycosyltransferase family 4 protein [uncultured Marinococcus sp.]
MNKKILQVCAVDLTVDKLLMPLILESRQNGFETEVACKDTGLTNGLKKENINFFNVNIDRSISLISNLSSIFELYKIMKKGKYDIVHVHTPVAALIARIAAKLARVNKVVYTAHGFYFHEEMSKKKYYFFFTLEKYAAKFLTDWLLLQSIEDYQLALENNFISSDKIIHLSNGVDLTDKFNPELINQNHILKLKKELKINDKEIVFIFIGRLVKEKGIVELLKAFDNVSKFNSNARLLVIGDLPASERDKETFKEINNLLNKPKIDYLGFRKDTEQLLYLSEVFILPSYREGLPRSIIEAMAMLNAIIATNIRGCREEVQHEKNGLLIRAKSVADLEKAINKMIKNEHQRKLYQKESRKIALNNFNEEKVLSKQVALFKKITKG